MHITIHDMPGETQKNRMKLHRFMYEIGTEEATWPVNLKSVIVSSVLLKLRLTGLPDCYWAEAARTG